MVDHQIVNVCNLSKDHEVYSLSPGTCSYSLEPRSLPCNVKIALDLKKKNCSFKFVSQIKIDIS